MSESDFEKTSEAERQLMPPDRARWTLWPWLLLLVLLAVMLVVRASRKPPVEEKRGEQDPAVGTKLTSFHLEPLTGDAQPASEADLEGKVTLINFWGPWCPACSVEFPHLMEIEEHFRGDPDFQFFSVSTNADPRDERGLREGTERFLKQRQATFATYRDPDGATIIAIAKAAGSGDFGFPTTVLLGPGGVIRALWLGYVPNDETAVRQAIDHALADLRSKS